MYRHHHHGGGWGGGFYGRRVGFPLFGGGGGWGMGMGGGDGLIGDLMAGGLGYMVGRQQGANQQQQYPPQYQQPAPQYQQPAQQYQQPAQQYQQPAQQYQQPAPQYQQTPAAQALDQNGQLAQLRLLGQLRASGVLTDQEFQEQKQKILNGF